MQVLVMKFIQFAYDESICT